MLCDRQQGTPQIHHTGAIQAERFNGGAASRRETNHKGKIVVPGKVITPCLCARVKQLHRLTHFRISGEGLRSFGAVAAATSISQIL